MDSSVRVWAVVGRNPAPLVQLLWGLAGVRGEKVVEVRCVLLGERSAAHFDQELLGPGAAYAQLRACLGERLPLELGREVVEDGVGEAGWRWARALTSRPQPVRFAVFPGRHRRAALEAATAFNFLGRQRDEFLEVSLGVRGGDGVKGFYFPGQPGGAVGFPDGSVRAPSSVEVQLEPLPLPRLRRLLPDLVEATWESVSVLGQRRLDGLGAPELVVDLESGTARVGHVPVVLAPLPLAWLAALARARVQGGEDGWLYSDSSAALAEVLAVCARQPWVADSTTKVLRRLVDEGAAAVDGEPSARAYLARVRQVVKQKLGAVARKHFPLHVQQLVPEVGQGHSHGGPDHRQRLPLSPECIHVVGVL
ncbi:MAG: hypothetical protein RL653_540 [Pseudomonadota bacterium]|jgi:hypothetical protein